LAAGTKLVNYLNAIMRNKYAYLPDTLRARAGRKKAGANSEATAIVVCDLKTRGEADDDHFIVPLSCCFSRKCRQGSTSI
jgi:hypothetical protein